MWSGLSMPALLSLWTGLVSGFSNGRLSAACGDMVPQHGPPPRQDPPPYRLSLNRSYVRPGQAVTVSLQALSGASFRGFLIEARGSGGLENRTAGSFTPSDRQQSRALRCGRAPRSALSHRTAVRKTVIEAVWQSDRNPPPSVHFLVTVVQEYQVFWVMITGPLLVLTGATESPSTAGPVPTSIPAVLSAPFSSRGCGLTKSCLRDPEDCDPGTDSGCVFLSFSAEASGRSVLFELSGQAEGYVSFALSLDRWMGNDDVFLCVKDGGGVTIRAAHVAGRTQPELQAQDALWGGAWRLDSGTIQCRFHRNSILPPSFSFNRSYFLFVARGGSHEGSVLKHQQPPLVSRRQAVISGAPEELRASRPPLLLRLHGVLMLTAWMWTVSFSLLIARHYKHVWTNRTLLGHKVWFQLHRSLMVLSLILTSVGFVLPFIYRRGWSKVSGSHSSLGCAVLTLLLLQMWTVWFRPAPQSPRRIVFSWIHFALGSFTHILAVACVFQDLVLPPLLLRPPRFPAGLWLWLMWVFLPDLLVRLHRFTVWIRGLRLRLPHRIRQRNRSEDQQNMLTENQQEESLTVRKTLLLLLFLLGHSSFLAAFIHAFYTL